jgi:hypothetical protein
MFFPSKNPAHQSKRRNMCWDLEAKNEEVWQPSDYAYCYALVAAVYSLLGCNEYLLASYILTFLIANDFYSYLILDINKPLI